MQKLSAKKQDETALQQTKAHSYTTWPAPLQKIKRGERVVYWNSRRFRAHPVLRYVTLAPGTVFLHIHHNIMSTVRFNVGSISDPHQLFKQSILPSTLVRYCSDTRYLPRITLKAVGPAVFRRKSSNIITVIKFRDFT